MTSLVSFKIDTLPLERTFRRAPIATYFWMRGFMGLAFEFHRREFKRSTRIEFGRGRGGTKTPALNKAAANPSDNVIAWGVRPAAKRAANIGQAISGLEILRGESFTESEVLEAHERGATIFPQTREFLAVPLVGPGGKRRGRRTPAQLAKRINKSSRLVTLRNSKGTLVIYERKRKRGAARKRRQLTKSGRARKTQRRVKVDELIPRFVLTPSADLEPRLDYYATWDRQRPRRDSLFSGNVDRLMKDLARGVTT